MFSEKRCGLVNNMDLFSSVSGKNEDDEGFLLFRFDFLFVGKGLITFKFFLISRYLVDREVIIHYNMNNISHWLGRSKNKIRIDR